MIGHLEGSSGSGEWHLVAGTVDAVGDWCDSSRRDWLCDMVAIGLEDLTGACWGMGNGGRPNMSAKALCRSWASLVLALPLGGSVLPLASAVTSWCVRWMICWVLGDTGREDGDRVW